MAPFRLGSLMTFADCAFEGYFIDGSPDDIVAEIIDPTLTMEDCNQACSEQPSTLKLKITIIGETITLLRCWVFF